MRYIRREFKQRMPFWLQLSVLLPLVISLTGCMYQGEAQQSGVNYRESVKRIQAAVDDYQQEEGLLPILNADETTPRYEKFRIDLNKLQEQGYLDDLPATAFEKGGSAYFLILDEETDPAVKVMDLITVQKVNDVQRQVNRYKSAHGGELPAKEELYPGLYTIDAKEAGTDTITLNSVYSGQPLEFIMDQKGNVYVDYVFDIMAVIDKNGGEHQKNEDLRLDLEQASYYVPVKSLPYLWVNGQPVPQPPGS
ncbi:hypothetical protein [Paenibacillus albidus]|uniref:hypothetical protein n=1 Tax=Paenibacillus albidus TaxID=2041023 RepID=UPI00288B15D3|nr:hypothetical protein [Paenibacillus albidus]